MNVDRRRWGTSVVGVRIVIAGLVLLAIGCAVLGWGTRLGKFARNGTAPGTPAFGIEATADTQARAHSILAGLPLIFEPNQGQAILDPADPHAVFVTRGSGYSMVLRNSGAVLSLVSRTHSGSGNSGGRVQTLQMRFAGANPKVAPSGEDRLPGKSNYFIGNDPTKWRTGVPHFAHVRYENIYPGINLVFYGNDGRLEYDFQVAPGADPAQAELEFSGSKRLELKDGSLVIRGEGGSIRLESPTVYQEIEGRRQPVEGAFVLRADNRVGFAIGTYDHSRELIIDPILNFSSYFGGSGDEHNTFVAVDGSLNIYLAGSTTSPDLPVTSGALQGTLAGAQNVYVAKIQPPLGSVAAVLLNLTYLGGTGTDYPVGIKVDGEGNPYLAGTTTSGDFPTSATTAYQATPASSGTHVFVTKLKFDFSQLLYSSYLSGNGTDIASGMTIDPAGNLYLTGTTTSVETSTSDQFPASNLPETLPFQSTPRATAGTAQFFVTKVNTTAPKVASIPYSTYFGGGTFNGTLVATGGGIAVDSNLNVYFTGTTNFTYSGCTGCSVTDFPILNAYQPCLDSPPAATVVNPQTCDVSSNPTLPDAFVAKLNPNASGQAQQLVWSTYLGGNQTDSGLGVAVDSGATNVYVVGTTNSPQFLNSGLVKSFASYQACLDNSPPTPASGSISCVSLAGSNDAYVARVSNPTTGTTNVALNYFSYLGGQNDEEGRAITVDSNSGALITGSTRSPFTGVNTAGTFPLNPSPSSIQSQLNGTQNAFIARINTGAVTGQTTTASWASYFGGNGIDAGTGIALDINQNTYLAGETSSTNLQVSKALQTNNNGLSDSFVAQLRNAFSLSIQGTLSLGNGQQFISAGNPATFNYVVTNNGPDLASNIVITANLSTAVTGVPLTNVSATMNSGTCGGGSSSNTSISCGPVSLQSGSTVTVTITATPTATSSGSSPFSFNGGTVQAIGPDNIVLAQTSVPARMTDFSMSVSPSNQAVSVAGASVPYAVQLTPHPVYSSGITISCSNLPPATTCHPSTSPVTLSNSSGASVVLSVATTARPTTTASANFFTRRVYAIWLMIPAMVFVGIGGNRRRRRIFGFLTLCMLLSLTLLIPACSSSGKQQAPVAGTPAGNYSITVTAAAGSDSKSQTIGLSVP